MHLTVHLPRARRRRSGHDGTARRSPRPATAALRERRAPAPQDAAFYTCECGFAWTGAVTTSVGCPHCGASQAW